MHLTADKIDVLLEKLPETGNAYREDSRSDRNEPHILNAALAIELANANLVFSASFADVLCGLCG